DGKPGAIRRAGRFLARQQRPDGGFPLSPGGTTNAQSTAWAVQGLVAAGHHPAKVRSALAYLEGLTAPKGAVHYSRTSAQTPVWVTAQALPALARKPFPLAAVTRRSAPLPAPTSAPTPTPTLRAARAKPAPVAFAAPARERELRRIARAAGRLAAVVL
ncbi:MAG: energy-coupling factor transport system substrate-specific component, partial [Solirubrobacteraceae bacterium]|nr:energy-coupling factor transport system substrate-specific component [Solirubrobacteraceae bacterium]